MSRAPLIDVSGVDAFPRASLTDKTSETPETWGEPDQTILTRTRAAPPSLPADLFCAAWWDWLDAAAEAKGAPVDYVAASLLAVAGALIGNARWSSPWLKWSEPPILWVNLIGEPSAGKSPAMSAVLEALRPIERNVRAKAERTVELWKQRKAAAKEAAEDFDEPKPHVSRLEVSDATIERLGTIASLQPRGAFLVADELASLLANLGRYSGGDDAPFWLKAYVGQFHVVERQSYALRIEHLSIGVLGGIQPDRLNELLLNRARDGFLARFLTVWPLPAPLRRPTRTPEIATATRALQRIYDLEMHEVEGAPLPWHVPWTEGARAVIDSVRAWVREEEARADGLLKDHIGKLPGLVVRLALILLYLDWAIGEDWNPAREVGEGEAERAFRFVRDYALPMAQRAYADASVPKEERAAHAIARLTVTERLDGFTVRDIAKRERAGLRSSADIEAGLDVLIQAHWLKPQGVKPGPRGGRPTITYNVNPAVWSFAGSGGFGGQGQERAGR
jgi:hypothetical protein